jgi:hypothetical protein
LKNGFPVAATVFNTFVFQLTTQELRKPIELINSTQAQVSHGGETKIEKRKLQDMVAQSQAIVYSQRNSQTIEVPEHLMPAQAASNMTYAGLFEQKDFTDYLRNYLRKQYPLAPNMEFGYYERLNPDLLKDLKRLYRSNHLNLIIGAAH